MDKDLGDGDKDTEVAWEKERLLVEGGILIGERISMERLGELSACFFSKYFAIRFTFLKTLYGLL